MQNYEVLEDRILFKNDELFKLLRPISQGSHSDVYKVRIENDVVAIKKFNWIYDENISSIKDKLNINIDSYITPKKLMYINGKFEGYAMKYCIDKDLSKRNLNITIDSFTDSSIKLIKDTENLSKLGYFVYDTYITNVMYDCGLKMIDTDEYYRDEKFNYDKRIELNKLRVTKLLIDIFIKNSKLSSLYFKDDKLKKIARKCEINEIDFIEFVNIIVNSAREYSGLDIKNLNEIGKILIKSKKSIQKS